MVKYSYSEMTSEELKDAIEAQRVVILPVGSIEQHGPHLPLGTDAFLVEEVCARAVKRIPAEAVLAPLIPYGFNEESMDFPGTVTVEATAFIDYVYSVCRCFSHHGFKRIIIVNGHGNNIPYLCIASDRILYQTNSICAMVSYYQLSPKTVADTLETEVISHADELETSLILATLPQLVYMSKARKDVDKIPGSKWIYWGTQKPRVVHFMDFDSRISESGIVGDPTKASKNKGEIILEAFVTNLVDFIKDFRKRQISSPIDHHK